MKTRIFSRHLPFLHVLGIFPAPRPMSLALDSTLICVQRCVQQFLQFLSGLWWLPQLTKTLIFLNSHFRARDLPPPPILVGGKSAAFVEISLHPIFEKKYEHI